MNATYAVRMAMEGRSDRVKLSPSGSLKLANETIRRVLTTNCSGPVSYAQIVEVDEKEIIIRVAGPVVSAA